MIASHDALPGPLGARWPTWPATAGRRAAAARKLAVYGETHLDLVNATIDTMLGGGQVARDVRRFARLTGNVAKATTDAIAVAYRSGCRRELKGASPELARVFAEIVAESKIDQYAAGLNARSWIAGPHGLGPALSKRRRLVLDRIGPDRLEVRREGDDIEAAVWTVGDGFVEVDENAWHYFDKNGEEYQEPILHGVGVAPLVPFRSFDGGDDWWARGAHGGLIDATLQIAFWIAAGCYKRQVAGTPLTVIYSDMTETPAGQVLGHPVQPLQLAPGDKVEVFASRVARAEDWLSEVAALTAMAVSTEGLPPGSVSLQASNADWGNLAISAEGPRLAAHRDKQVPFVRGSELEFWAVAFDFLRASAHRHARVLPPGNEAREMLRIYFPDLSSPDEQLKRIEVMKAGIPFGLSSPSDVLLAAQPELTREEVEEFRRVRLAEHVESVQPLIRGNIPGETPEAHGVQTIAQLQGRVGGEASGAARAA